MRVNFCQIKAARKQIAALSVEHPTLPWQKLAFSWKVRPLLNNFVVGRVAFELKWMCFLIGFTNFRTNSELFDRKLVEK